MAFSIRVTTTMSFSRLISLRNKCPTMLTRHRRSRNPQFSSFKTGEVRNPRRLAHAQGISAPSERDDPLIPPFPLKHFAICKHSMRPLYQRDPSHASRVLRKHLARSTKVRSLPGHPGSRLNVLLSCIGRMQVRWTRPRHDLVDYSMRKGRMVPCRALSWFSAVPGGMS